MESPNTSSDEINLEDVFLKFVLTVKRNFILVVLCFAVGTLLGYTQAMLGQKVYESKMLVTSDVLKESYAVKMGELLNKILGDGNVPLFATELNLTNEEAVKVGSIQIEAIEKPAVEEKTLTLLITARVIDQEILPKLEKGIVYFLENNPYAKSRVEQKKIFFTELINTQEREIKMMEQFRTDLFTGNFFTKNSGNLMINPSEINEKIVEISEEKLKNENELKNVSAIEIVQGFIKFNNPISPNKVISMSAGASLGLIMVSILIGLKGIRRILRAAEESKHAA